MPFYSSYLWQVLALYFVNLARKTYVESLRTDLFTNARLVADQANPFLTPPLDYTGLNTLAHRLAPLVGARITIVKPDGIVVGESDADANVMENHLTRPEIKAAVGGIEDAETRFSSTVHKDFLYAAVPVRSEKAVIGVVRLAVPLTQLELIPAAIRRATLNVTLLAMLVGIILSLAISRFAVSPLTGLSRAVKAFADGKLSHPHLPVSTDEVGQLNQAFIRMASDLRSQFQTLKTEQASLAAVLAQMTDGVIIVDAAGNVRLSNPAAERIFQSGRKAAIGQSLIEVVRHYQIVEAWRHSLDSGEQQSVTLEVAAEKIFLHVVATPLGEMLPGNTLLLFQDLTRVRRLETVRQDFISNVSHELRTPLAAMKAITETLQEGALDDPPAAKGFLERMNGEIDTMAQLIQELLELARIESGRAPLQKVRLTPAEILHPAVERMRLQAERAGLSLDVNAPGGLPPVRVDRDRIEQVLINILHNAVKFTPAGGRITAAAEESEGGAIFSIRDTGIGIPSEDLERIFERFYKRDKARSSGGTGLGLSIAKRIVEAHGGRIWAESQPGAGSVFYFFIPS